MTAGMLAVGEAAIQATVALRHFAKALGRLNADLRKFNNRPTSTTAARRAERQANRRPALIHNGGKP